MNLLTATNIVDSEFRKYSLYQQGWTFQWDRAKQRFGQCTYHNKLIKMSRELTELNTEEQFTDTLRHEIAHAIVGPGHHHNTKWKVAAIQVGAKPERCYSSADVIESKAPWVGTCKDCGMTVKRHRYTRRIYVGCWHTKCKRLGKPNKGEIVWVKTEGL